MLYIYHTDTSEIDLFSLFTYCYQSKQRILLNTTTHQSQLNLGTLLTIRVVKCPLYICISD